MIAAALLDKLTTLAQPFADVYADSKVLSVGTTMLHIGGLLAGGGLAIATDRAVLRMPLHDGTGQRAVLNDITSTHRLVVGALVIIAASGLMFLAADVGTFLVSPIYWAKMLAVLLLLANGIRLWRAESSLKRSTNLSADNEPMPVAEWRALRASAITSLGLWFVILALGVVLEGS